MGKTELVLKRLESHGFEISKPEASGESTIYYVKKVDDKKVIQGNVNYYPSTEKINVQGKNKQDIQSLINDLL